MIEKPLTVPTTRRQESRTGLIQIDVRQADPQISVVRDDLVYDDDKLAGRGTHSIGRLGSRVATETVTLADQTVLSYVQISEAIKRLCDRWDTEGGNQIAGPRGR